MESEQHGYMGTYLNVESQMGDVFIRVVIDESDGSIVVYQDDNQILFQKTITEHANGQ